MKANWWYANLPDHEPRGMSAGEFEIDELASLPMLYTAIKHGERAEKNRSGGYVRSVEEAQAAIAYLKSLDLTCVYRDGNQTFWSHPRAFFSLYVTDQGYILIESFTLTGFDLKGGLPTFRPQEGTKPCGSLYTLMGESNNMRVNTFEENMGRPIQRENYVDEVLATYDAIANELVADTPQGRLSILEGPPGTGKTTLIQNLIYELATTAKFIYVPAHMVKNLSDPGVLPVLQDFKRRGGGKVVLILEDADECLTHREDGNAGQVSALLNLADGLLGKGLDLRIVATTNDSLHIDEAASRAGRLFKRVKVANLPREKAIQLLYYLVPSAVTKAVPFNNLPISLADVYAEAFRQGWKPPVAKETKVTFQLDTAAVYASLDGK